MVGRAFGRWVVLREMESGKGGHDRLECLCECGTIRVVAGSNLRRGGSQSCGCLLRELAATRCTKHGEYGTPAYQSWSSMKNRCKSPNHIHYDNYGGRGIMVCDRWQDFRNFLEDMGQRNKGEELDRIDNNGNYCKENCRWVTSKENARNRSSNTAITYNGETRTLMEWSEILGVGRSMLNMRRQQGWTIERMLTEPARVHKRRLNVL